MKNPQEDYIIKRLLSYVSQVFDNTLVENYYGPSLSLKMLNHVENIIVLENIKDKKYISALKYSAILHNVDNKLFFDENNSNVIIEELFSSSILKKYIKEILELIHHPNKSVNDGESWMLIPRYIHMLESIGEQGLVRLYFFYCFYNKRIFPKNSSIEPIDFYKLKELVTEHTNKHLSMCEYYINLLNYGTYLENTGVPYITCEARNKIKVMEEYFYKIKENKINANEIIKIKRKLEKKKLL